MLHYLYITLMNKRVSTTYPTPPPSFIAPCWGRTRSQREYKVHSSRRVGPHAKPCAPPSSVARPSRRLVVAGRVLERRNQRGPDRAMRQKHRRFATPRSKKRFGGNWEGSRLSWRRHVVSYLSFRRPLRRLKHVPDSSSSKTWHYRSWLRMCTRRLRRHTESSNTGLCTPRRRRHIDSSSSGGTSTK